MTGVWLFVAANWLTILAVVLYLVANVVPRPDPSRVSPGWSVFWQIVDRLCFLSREALPGGWKAIGALSPIVIPKADPEKVAVPAAEAQSAAEEKKP